MSKKIDLDDAAKKVEDISNTVNTISKNRLIIAFLLIVDGITFLLNPDTTIDGMAKNIIMLVGFATLTIFLTNAFAKKKDVKTIIISLVILVLCVIFYFFPSIISAYIQLLLSLFIIYNGLTNMASALHWNRLSRFTKSLAQKVSKIGKGKKPSKEKAARAENFKEVDKTINDELEQQKKKLINPLENIVSHTKKTSVFFVILNALSVIFGIILLIFPGVSMSIWGIIFLYTGISNFLAAVKAMDLKKKIKERRFKDILFDSDQQKDAAKNSTKDAAKK